MTAQFFPPLEAKVILIYGLALLALGVFLPNLNFVKEPTESEGLIILGTGLICAGLLVVFINPKEDEVNSAFRAYLSAKIFAGKSSEGNDVSSEKEPEATEEESSTLKSEPKNYNDGSLIDKPAKTDIFAQMLKNSEEINEYFKISKRQARQSYTISLITCIAGVALLFVAIAILVVTQKVSLAVIPAVSGAITEVVSGTVLWVYNKSATQLNHYYDALHENERYLSVVNLVSNLSLDKQDAIYMEIIRSQLNYITQGNMRNKEGADPLTPSMLVSNGEPSGKGK